MGQLVPIRSISGVIFCAEDVEEIGALELGFCIGHFFAGQSETGLASEYYVSEYYASFLRQFETEEQGKLYG